MNNPYSSQSLTGTPSMDLPPALSSILDMGRTTPLTPPMDAGGIMSGMQGPQDFAPSYEAGGMIGAQGMPVPMGAAPGGMPPPPQMPPAQGVGVSPNVQPNAPMDYSMLEMQLNQFASQHPQQMQQIKQEMMQSLQSGELTSQELNMTVQLATVAAQNPQMYPYVRNFAIQQGIATEEDLSPQYDQGLIFSVLLAGRALQGGQGGQGIPSMKVGGTVPSSQKNDGSVLINAHEGEYVIPQNVVQMKGKEFFDNLVAKYRDEK